MSYILYCFHSNQLSDHLDSQQSELDNLQGNFSGMFGLNPDAFSDVRYCHLIPSLSACGPGIVLSAVHLKS